MISFTSLGCFPFVQNLIHVLLCWDFSPLLTHNFTPRFDAFNVTMVENFLQLTYGSFSPHVASPSASLAPIPHHKTVMLNAWSEPPTMLCEPFFSRPSSHRLSGLRHLTPAITFSTLDCLVSSAILLPIFFYMAFIPHMITYAPLVVCAFQIFHIPLSTNYLHALHGVFFLATHGNIRAEDVSIWIHAKLLGFSIFVPSGP